MSWLGVIAGWAASEGVGVDVVTAVSCVFLILSAPTSRPAPFWPSLRPSLCASCAAPPLLRTSLDVCTAAALAAFFLCSQTFPVADTGAGAGAGAGAGVGVGAFSGVAFVLSGLTGSCFAEDTVEVLFDVVGAFDCLFGGRDWC